MSETVTIAFDDKGQDFLEWDVDAATGRVVACRPFQAEVWTSAVLVEDSVSVGDMPVIMISGGFRQLKHRIRRIACGGVALPVWAREVL